MSKLELGLGSFLPQFSICSAACKIWHCENQSTMGWDDFIPCSIHLSEIQFHQNLLIIGGCPLSRKYFPEKYFFRAKMF